MGAHYAEGKRVLKFAKSVNREIAGLEKCCRKRTRILSQSEKSLLRMAKNSYFKTTFYASQENKKLKNPQIVTKQEVIGTSAVSEGN